MWSRPGLGIPDYSESPSKVKRVLLTIPGHRWPRPLREERRDSPCPVTLQVSASSPVRVGQSSENFVFMPCLLDSAQKPHLSTYSLPGCVCVWGGAGVNRLCAEGNSGPCRGFWRMGHFTELSS